MKPALDTTRPYVGWWIDAAGLAACLVVSIASYALGVAPLVQRSADLRDAIQQHRRQEQVMADMTQSLDQLKHRLEQNQDALNEAVFELQPISRLNQYLARLTDLAKQNGLSLHEIKSGQPIAFKHYRSIPIDLSGTGTYQDSVRFLHNLNKNFLDIRVSALNLSVLTHSPTPRARIDMSLVWHAALTGPAKRP